jgi:exopolyphosphatase/guanosine-5'-triphosphate,3'-diphosphate pyrophosphatase
MNTKLSAILELARRYNYDSGHAHQVECLAGTLFMELEPLHQLGRDDRKLLEYAAILHDIGYFVSAKGHHRHALQMIMMEPLLEFSREEKTIIANLARYHRKTLPTLEHTAYGILSEADRQRVNLLAPILRVADALDRAHQGQVQELFCDLRDDAVTIYVGAENEMPIEARALDNKADMFRQVYRRDVTLRVLRPRLPKADLETSAFMYEGVA